MSRTVLARWVAALPLLVLACVAIAGTALLSYTLISRGVGEGRPSWTLLGALAGLVWLSTLRMTLRRQ